MTKKQTRFSSEAQLVGFVLEILGKKMQSDMRVFDEIKTLNGIADLMIVKLDESWERQKDLAAIPMRWGYALRALPFQQAFTLEDFSSLSGVSKQVCKEVLRYYEIAGYVTSDAGTWEKIRLENLISKETIAIEVKLKNWRRALYQASRYRSIANQSWVIMDAQFAKPAIANVQDFRKFNVGLMIAKADGGLAEIFKPERREPLSQLMLWCFNVELAARTA